MKISKKLISIIFTICIIASCTVIAGISASAVEAKNLTVTEYKTRTDYMNNFNAGNYTDCVKIESGELDMLYSFTLSKPANIMANYGVVIESGTLWNYQYSLTFYKDANLINEVKLSTAVDNNKAYYGFLEAGTYYVRMKKANTNPATMYLYLGQVSKDAKFATVSYVKTNNDKTYTLQINSTDKISAISADTCNYGAQNSSTIKTCGKSYTFNDKNQFTMATNGYTNAYVNICVRDTNGYETVINTRVLNKYTDNSSGYVSKMAYTGKALKQPKTLVVKAGYDQASYKAAYKNNKNIGTASVTFKGTDNVIGSVTKTFKIVPSKVTGLTAKVKGAKATLSWGKSKGASSYLVEKKVKGAWKKVKTLKGTKVSASVSKGTTTFRVRGFKKVGKVTYYSDSKTVNAKR